MCAAGKHSSYVRIEHRQAFVRGCDLHFYVLCRAHEINRKLIKSPYHLSFCNPHTNVTSLFPSMTGVSEEKDRTKNYPKLTAKMASLISSRLLGFSFPFLSTLPNERRYLSHRLLSTSIILQHTQPQMSRLPTVPAEPCIPDLPQELRSPPRN